jgi:hypothetical protein
MKRILLISVLAAFLLSSCFLMDDFKESTLTFVNGSDFDVTQLSVDTGSAGRRTIYSPSLLNEGESIAPGEDMLIGLTPILHDESSVNVRVTTSDGENEVTYIARFTYGEGADVVLTLDPEEDLNFVIEEGELDTK